jgi:hypothetical protein
MDKLKYNFITPDLPENVVGECLNILDNLNSRKTDKVNWAERKQMDEATKRSGQYITHEEDAYEEAPKQQVLTEKQQNPETNEAAQTKTKSKKQKQIVAEEEKVEVSDKERDLMDELSGVMKLLEGIDGSKK